MAKTTRTDAAAAKERWIQEQMKHFPPGSMDGFIRQLRAYERAARERASRGVAA